MLDNKVLKSSLYLAYHKKEKRCLEVEEEDKNAMSSSFLIWWNKRQEDKRMEERPKKLK